jgi:hypothetical protein
MFQRRTLALALGLAGVFGATTGLRAQACQGIPQRSHGAFSFAMGFPEDAKTYSLSGFGSSDGGNIFFGASFGVTTWDAEGVENQKTAGGLIAYEIASLTPDASVCPTVGVTYSWVEDFKTWSVPFGVGFGKTMYLEGRGTALTPYVVPQFLFVETSWNDLTENDWYFGLSAGATFSFTSFFIGGSVSKIFEEGSDAVFGAFVGVAWR